ncbi:MAG: acyltransferase family protein [Planctomycetota bacterium]
MTSPATTQAPTTLPRRHEIDAIRSIALLLLIAYHVFVAFQPFAPWVEFIGYEQTLDDAWFIGELINPWRIPVLFLISGITAGYLLQNRSINDLVRPRLMRLVPPLVVAVLLIAPISPALYHVSIDETPRYIPQPLHLWFVWNLVVYFLIAIPVFLYLKYREHNVVIRTLRACTPLGWLVFVSATLFVFSRLLEPHINADSFSIYFMRFWYGFACFICGSVLVSLGESFWTGIRWICHVALPIAVALYVLRMMEFEYGGENTILFARTVESVAGMLAFLGYGSLLFSRPSGFFGVLNRSVFPVYIVHLPVQQVLAFYLFRIEMNPWTMFSLHLVGTILVSVLIYALILRPIRWLHPIFGIAPTGQAKSRVQRTDSGDSTQKRWPTDAARIATLYLATPILVIIAFIMQVFMLLFYTSIVDADMSFDMDAQEQTIDHIEPATDTGSSDDEP